MKKAAITGALLFSLVAGVAQVALKTIVTQGPVVAGEPFQVQYVLEETDPVAEFLQPDFRPFQLVSGPHIYGGVSYSTDGPRRLKNFTFTLLAPKAGEYIVPAASIKLRGITFRSEPASILVITKQLAIKKGMLAEGLGAGAESFLQPGEDPYDKIRKNLFMRVSVDRKTCVVGQPVTATFKLYSRLKSKSEIIKNPAFYGFAMQDLISLSDHVMATETVNGHDFSVHTIRKVQLYPLQAGMLTIDPMEVRNRVEFSRSTVTGRPEQEIVEGVIPSEDKLFSTAGSKIFESVIHSEPVSISVKSLPAAGRPDNFSGATGRFSISASASRDLLAVGEEGAFLVTIEGRGNFSQLIPPAVSWPQGIEAFAPEITDSLGDGHSSADGKRLFRFRFVAAEPGDYSIPGVGFSFFDPDSNRYRVVQTEPVKVNIAAPAAKEKVSSEVTTSEKGMQGNAIWLRLAVVLGIIALLFAAVRRLVRSKKTINAAPEVPPVQKPTIDVNITELMQPPSILLHADDHSFFSALRAAIWNFISRQFELSGSRLNRQMLIQSLTQEAVPDGDQQVLLNILQACDEGLFTGATATANKQTLLEETKEVLLRIKKAQRR